MFLSGGKYVNKIKRTMIDKISLILKMVIGSAISWELAVLFGSKYPYLGPISLIICLQATIIKSIKFGLARIVGTIIGVLSVFILAPSLHANGWSIAVIMLVSLVIPLILKANSIVLHQIALSVLLVLEFEHKLHGYGMDRIRDSIIGVAVALLLQLFLNPPTVTKRTISEVEVLPIMLADKLKSLATWLEAGASPKNFFYADMNLLHKKILDAECKMEEAELSLRFNPISKKSKPLLHEAQSLLKTLNQVSTELDFLYKIMDEWSQTGLLTKDSINAWIQNFYLLESAIRNWNDGKIITDIVFNETLSNKNFHFSAIWHAHHLIATLKQQPR